MSFTSTTQTETQFSLDEAQPQWLVVESGGELLGLPLEQVREVLRPQGLCSVPGSPAAQAGIINVRGAILTVIDLNAARMGESAERPGSIVVLQHGALVFGVTVEAVHDVRSVLEDATSGDVSQKERPQVVPLDAAALCARLLHSVEESER